MSAKIYVNGIWMDLSDPQVTITPIMDQFCYRNEPKKIPVEVNYGGHSPFGTVVVEGLPNYATYSNGVIQVSAPDSTERETHEITVKVINDNVMITGIKFLLKVAGAAYVSAEGLYLRDTTIFQEDAYTDYPDITDPDRCVGPVSNGSPTPYKILNGALYCGDDLVTNAPTNGSYAVMFAHNNTSSYSGSKCYVLHSDGLVYPVSYDAYIIGNVNELTGITKISGYTGLMFMTDTTVGYYGDGSNSAVATLGVSDPIVDIAGPCYSTYQYGGFIAAGTHLFCCKYSAPYLTLFPTSYDFPTTIKKLASLQGSGNNGVYVLTEDGKLYSAKIVSESEWEVVEIVTEKHTRWSDVSGYPSTVQGALGICDGYLYLILNTTARLVSEEYDVTAISGIMYYAAGNPNAWKGGLFVANGCLYSIVPTSGMIASDEDIVSKVTISQVTNNGVPVQAGTTTSIYGFPCGTGAISSTILTGMIVSKKYDTSKYADDPTSIPVVSVNNAAPDRDGKVALQAELVPGTSTFETMASSSHGVYTYATATQPEMISLSFYSSGDGTATSYGYIEAGTYNSADQTFVRRAYGVLSPAKNAAITLTFMVAPGEVPAFRYESGKTFPIMQVRAVINKFTIRISPA